MQVRNAPPPNYAFGYRDKPRSGNEINGLGERQRRPAKPVFHSSGRETLDWAALDNYFSLTVNWGCVWHILRNRWFRRRAAGPVAARRVPVADPIAARDEIIAAARKAGADVAGVGGVDEYDPNPRETAGDFRCIRLCHPLPCSGILCRLSETF